ncbi:uncharacterized protein PAC_16402 [Phialocephala subalpina]|uniref:Uncharacterized protein n=1 Tax=Phialocephala subalpina TaxID=576137 RepID=A0A1L7XN65_9HELO|nr:uncharacterized protein PAC_16402 [Phialocephala subalpina]
MLDLSAGFSGIELTWWLGIFGDCLCMLGVQYLLLKTHRARKVLPAEVVPTQPELYAGVACFWLAFLGSIKTLVHTRRGLFWILSSLEVVDHDGLWRVSEILSLNETSVHEASDTKLGLQLFNRVLLTWQLHQALIFVLDTIIPFLKNLNRKPDTTLRTLCSRIRTLVAFLQLITVGHSASSVSPAFQLCIPESDNASLSTTQKIGLQRKQSSSPKKGRTLSWSLTVDKEALDEMKETLGPPGGFGELGFCVAKDEVRFEAMGVGTSFALVFTVEDEVGSVVKPATSRPEVKGKRRKTK